MRRYNNKEDEEYIKEINAEDWQVSLLKMNPDYPHWGPHEDYMIVKGEGWNSPLFFNSWKDFGPFELDDYNEVVNFYFQIKRKSEDCPICKGSGYSRKALELKEKWHNLNNAEWIYLENGRRFNKNAWSNNLNEDDIEALWKNNRLNEFKEKPSSKKVNDIYREGAGHDMINQHICITARLEKTKDSVNCSNCNGKGYLYIEDYATVSLVLWLLHPRKGASRGIEINNIKKEEIKEVLSFLICAKERNENRFSKIKDI